MIIYVNMNGRKWHEKAKQKPSCLQQVVSSHDPAPTTYIL